MNVYKEHEAMLFQGEEFVLGPLGHGEPFESQKDVTDESGLATICRLEKRGKKMDCCTV